LNAYDTQALPVEGSGKHSKKSISKDILTVIEQLVEVNILDTTSSHQSFSKLYPNLTKSLSHEDLKAWIVEFFWCY